MTALGAALPLAVVLAAMGIWHLSAARAGALGLGVAAVVALWLFTPPGGGALPTFTGAGLEAVSATAVILWIVLPALALYEYQDRVGALARLRAALTGLTADRRLQAILIAWFFGLFMEGAAGFGTPVALAAPLLAGLGYPPVRAVVLALLGHAAGVSFGAVGTPTLAQIGLTGLSATGLAGSVALMQALVSPILLLAMVRLAGEGPLTASDLAWSALAWVSFAVPSVALAALTGPELPSLGGALIGLVLFAALLTRTQRTAMRLDFRFPVRPVHRRHPLDRRHPRHDGLALRALRQRRFEGHEIKYGAKLTVREGQAAVFVHEGQLADVFTPGLYMLETNNMPIMTTLQHWDHGFQSPFKSEIYFVNTNRFTNLKWGTKNPIMLRDPEFGPTRIRAFGTYTVKVADPARS
jgi:hypothetical protein